MSPEIALSLSFEGISLLCRVEDGWHKLGDVALDNADLDGALADLRELAEKHADGKPLCKLIVPNEQIKYVSVESHGEELDAQVTNVLQDATPYDVADLVYDFVEVGDQLLIAAVAKETLEEAEAFSLQHGFQGVCFVAMPEEGAFEGEPFFGTTGSADQFTDRADQVEPSEAAIVIVSEGPLPEPTPEEKAPPAFASSRFIAANEVKSAPDLPGATKDESPQPAKELGPAEPSKISAQPARFTPAALAEGMRKRPVPAAEPAPELKAEPKADVVEPAPAEVTSAKKTLKKSKRDFKLELGGVPADEIGGKPKFLGVILIAILLAFLAGVAAWASLFTDQGIAGLFTSDESVDQIALIPQEDTEIETGALAPVDTNTVTDSAEIEAMDDNEGTVIDPVLEAVGPTLSGEAFYAATGIWDRAPTQPTSPLTESSEEIYIASFETSQQTHDAIALPQAETFGEDLVIAQQNNPVAAGTTFEFDDRGFVVASAEGALTPEGVMVYLGPPAVVPASLPTRAAVETVAPVEEDPFAELATYRPRVRPSDLIEQNQRATLGGSTLAELAKIRPQMRPERTPTVNSSTIDDVVNQELVASLRPQLRPSGFAQRAQEQKERLAAVPVPQTQAVAPTIPTTASVARQATQNNVLNLRKINLIGVYGSSADRRALVRLSSGRYRKVKIGDRIDGGRVAAISSSELRYVKGNNSIVLKMPKG